MAWDNKGMPDFRKLDKGRLVYVCGRLRTSKYTANDGVEKTHYEVVATKISLEDPTQEQSVV